MRFFYPNADEIFDFSREIIFLDKQLNLIIPERERSKGDRQADLLARVYLKDGTERWVICNVEIESDDKISLAFRLFQYWYRIIDRFHVQAMSIAVYTGDREQPSPSSYHTNLLDTELHFKFRGYQIFQHSDKELLKMRNPFSLVVLAAKKAAQYDYLTDKQLNRARVLILQALRADGTYSVEQIESFALFLTNLIYIQDSKENLIFDMELQKTSKGALSMGIIETVRMQDRQQGYHEAEEKKNTDFVTNLIEQTGFDDAKIASLAVVSIDFVQKVRASLVKKQK